MMASRCRPVNFPGSDFSLYLSFLEGVGCHNFQGYYFGRPAPVEALERFFIPAAGGVPD